MQLIDNECKLDCNSLNEIENHLTTDQKVSGLNPDEVTKPLSLVHGILVINWLQGFFVLFGFVGTRFS